MGHADLVPGRIFNVLVSRLSTVRPVLAVFSSGQDSTELGLEEDPDGLHTCLYYLRIIHNVIEQPTTNVWQALAASTLAEGKIRVRNTLCRLIRTRRKCSGRRS